MRRKTCVLWGVAAAALSLAAWRADAQTIQGSQDDTAGVVLFSAGGSGGTCQNPSGAPAAQPTDDVISAAVAFDLLEYLGDQSQEVDGFTRGTPEGDSSVDTTLTEVTRGLQAIDDFGIIGGQGDDDANFDAGRGGGVTAGLRRIPGQREELIIRPDGVAASGLLGPAGAGSASAAEAALGGFEIFVFEDAELSGVTIRLTSPTNDITIAIDDRQVDPDTNSGADDTMIAIDLDRLPGFDGTFIDTVAISDDGVQMSDSPCPRRGETSLELDAVVVRRSTTATLINVDKSAMPTSVNAPGGPVTFTVQIVNDSTVDAVTIATLTDSIAGNLNGKGTCVVPQTIPPSGGAYTCTYTATVSGPPGDVVTTVAATGTDDDGGPVSGSAAATVTIVGPTPTATPPATATVSATRTFTPQPPSTPATATTTAASTPTITPTSPPCGDGDVDADEACDDGNQVAGDGCEPDCTVTCPFTHPGPSVSRYVNDTPANDPPGTDTACAAAAVSTIQAAVDASSDGDVVRVCPGSYVEAVLVSREVEIRATNDAADTIVDGGSTSGSAFTVLRSGVVLEGLTVVGGSAPAVLVYGICPLHQATCAAPGAVGSNVRLTGNVIRAGTLGVAWSARVDCATIANNTFEDNGRHLVLTQGSGTPAQDVNISGNTFARSTSSTGAGVEVRGMAATLRSNQVSDSGADGVRLGPGVAGFYLGSIEGSAGRGIVVESASRVEENVIRANGQDGVTALAGAAGALVYNNNIEGNGVGLGNEVSTGVLNAVLNWWGSRTGPSGVSWLDPTGLTTTGVGDAIVNRGAATTQFVEFLCGPAPGGTASEGGVCSPEQPEVLRVLKGDMPDVSPQGQYLPFVSNLQLPGPDGTMLNADGGQEVFLLNRKPSGRPGSFCLGGVRHSQSCTKQSDCPGDLQGDPYVLGGACVYVEMLTDDPTGFGTPSTPRVRKKGNVVFTTTANLLQQNPNGSPELYEWNQRNFRRQGPGGPDVLRRLSSGTEAEGTGQPVDSRNGRIMFVESAAAHGPLNTDGNIEIFAYDRHVAARSTAEGAGWSAMTDTLSPVSNRRPSTLNGKQVAYDSDRRDLGNSDGNREVFVALNQGTWHTQAVTTTVAPVENRAGGIAKRGLMVAFASNGDFACATCANADGNFEVFIWEDGVGYEQITHSTAGENVNPALSPRGRFVAFESTADLDNDPSLAANRRIFLFDRKRGRLTVVSRSLEGENFLPRISDGRFVVWSSTADLTERDAEGGRAIYVFDQRRDE